MNDHNRNLTSQTPGSLIGHDVGGYLVASLLGSGGMADVYRATAPDGSVVALKVLKGEFTLDPAVRQRFARELKVTLGIRHPHVVPVLDAGEHDGALYLCQRLIPGGSLRERLDRERPLPVTLSLRILEQVAAGLDELAARGLVHRDVKPANILLDGDHAYIADFGLVKRPQGTNLTRPGQTVGSLDYIAPEQIRGAEISRATDVYGLACVAYECLTGGAPFAKAKGMQLLWAHLKHTPPDLQSADVPPPLARAVLAGLAKEPSDRPADAGAFVGCLHRAVRR